MKKHCYELCLNYGHQVRNIITASFGRNRDITLHVSRDGILIIAYTSAVKAAPDILHGKDPLFADAVRKALLIYAIRYDKYLTIRSSEVRIDSERQAAYSTKGNEPLIYSLSEGKLRLPFGVLWNDPNVESAVAKTSKSAYDGRYSALHALLAAKSDRYEIERFTYYWMAMNGLYGYIAERGRKLLPRKYKKSKALANECAELGFLARCCGHEPCADLNGDGLPQAHRQQIRWHISAVLKRIKADEIDEFCTACLTEGTRNEYLSAIMDGMTTKDYDYHEIPSWSLMLTGYPYWVRCESFHADSALPTFCYADDGEVKALRVVNRLLDRFLTAELPGWISADEQTTGEHTGRIEQAANHPCYGKWRE